MTPHHTLIRILGFMNLMLGLIAFLLAYTLLQSSTEVWSTQAAFYAFGTLLSLALFMASAWGILQRTSWGRWVNLILAGLMLVTGVVFLMQREWSAVLFFVGYATLCGWLLLASPAKEYFRKVPEGRRTMDDGLF